MASALDGIRIIEVTQDIADGGGTVYDRWRTKDLKSLGSGADES